MGIFDTKKKKISAYLASKDAGDLTAFDQLLTHHLDGVLAGNIKNEGASRVEVHIDWHDDYKCIDIQGKVKDYFFNFQIEPEGFIYGIGTDEIEDYVNEKLTDRDGFYDTVHRVLSETAG